MLIATLSDTPERRVRLTLVDPHHYSSGVNVPVRKTEGFKRWVDLRNRPVAVEYGADIAALYGNELAKSALRDGRCSAFLYDDTAISALLIDPAWGQQFDVPLPTYCPAPWSVALPAGEFASTVEVPVSNAIIDWRCTGLLGQLEQKWGIPQSAFVDNMNALWSKRVDGVWFCGATVDAKTPKECR